MLTPCFSFAQGIRSAAICRVLFWNFHCIVLAFPTILLEPKEGESNGILLLLRRWNIHELQVNRPGLQPRTFRVLPIVAGEDYRLPGFRRDFP
jgi:hypothetical protein